MNMDAKAGAIVKAERRRMGYSQSTFAALLGIKAYQVGSIETGKWIPEAAVWSKINRILGTRFPSSYRRVMTIKEACGEARRMDTSYGRYVAWRDGRIAKWKAKGRGK